MEAFFLPPLASMDAPSASMPDWLARLDPLPLECNGMSRLVAAVLTQYEIGFQAYVGALEVEGVGRISLHWWIELPDDRIVDLRARMWLDTSMQVPHGIVTPSDQVRYLRAKPLARAELALHPSVFALMTGHTIESVMPTATEVMVSLKALRAASPA